MNAINNKENLIFKVVTLLHIKIGNGIQVENYDIKKIIKNRIKKQEKNKDGFSFNANYT